MRRHRILPFFLGGCHCPVGCVFCDQASQTGVHGVIDGAWVRRAIAQAVEDTRDLDERPLEVAFYGGTFTSLPPAQQADLLRAAAEEREAGRITRVRVSTHPRWLGPGHLDDLRRFGVDDIEVGVQSLDDEVLARSRRGVDAAETLRALERVLEAGFRLGVQLMVGLPGADRASDRHTAERLATVGASLARVYPTVVLRGALLAEQWGRGAYVPIAVGEAVVRAADQVAALEAGGVVVQRIGLHVDDALRAAVLAGPVDPAFGDRVRAELTWRRLLALATETAGTRFSVRVPTMERSHWVGHRGVNVERFEQEFPLRRLEIRVDPELPAGAVVVEAEG